MINGILQFIKKTILAINLARWNLLLLVSGLKTFQLPVLLARWFVVPNEAPLEQRICGFLKAKNNLYLNALVEEIAAQPDIVGTKFLWTGEATDYSLEGSFLFKSTAFVKDENFWQSLLKELVIKDFPKLKEQYNFFERRLDVLHDMRFYGSELELLTENTADLERSCRFDVDWIRTNKEKLWLCFDQDCRYSSKLEIKAQESLSRIFAFLLFEKNKFVSFWSGVSVNASGHVSFLDFDFIYIVDDKLKNFAISYIEDGASPKSLAEYKLVRALKLLEYYCPDIKIFKQWQVYFDASSSLFTINTDTTGLLQHLKKSGIIVDDSEKIKHTEFDDVSYLLDKNRHKKDPRYRKSSILYWGPLLIVIYFLLKHFPQ